MQMPAYLKVSLAVLHIGSMLSLLQKDEEQIQGAAAGTTAATVSSWYVSSWFSSPPVPPQAAARVRVGGVVAYFLYSSMAKISGVILIPWIFLFRYVCV